MQKQSRVHTPHGECKQRHEPELPKEKRQDDWDYDDLLKNAPTWCKQSRLMRV